MQSSVVVAGMDALSESCENILTRRANQRHYSIVAQFAKRPWPCPTTGSSSAIAGKKSLPTIEVAPARHSEGSPARCRAARACHARAPRRYRREPSSRPQHGNGSKYPPAEPGALGIGPLEAAIRGADAPLHTLAT